MLGHQLVGKPLQGACRHAPQPVHLPWRGKRSRLRHASITPRAASASSRGDDGKEHTKNAEMDSEIAKIALPMLITLAADPLAGLVETAFIGRLGAVELAGMAVGLSIFSTITKFLNIPLISSTTTAVARATGKAAQDDEEHSEESEQQGSQPQAASSSSEPGTAQSRVQSPGQQPTATSSSTPSSSSSADGVQGDSRGGSNATASSSSSSSIGASQSGSSSAPLPDVALPPFRHATRGGLDGGDDRPQQQRQGSAGPSSSGLSEQGQGSQGVGQAASDSHEEGEQSPISVAASSAILLAAVIGLLEVLFVCVGASSALRLWGVTSGASGDMYRPALDFLRIRALGAPVQVLMLTLQGVFRGLQDARTPLQCSLTSNFLNILLAPVLIFWLGWGVKGAAAAIIIAQALPTLYLLHALSKRVPLRLTSRQTFIQLTKLAGPSVWLMIRSMGSTWTYAFATATVARAGAAHAAAHQVCFQLWMATTLTSDAVAVAVQSLLARSMAQGDVPTSRRLVERCIGVGMGMGLGMALLVGGFRHALAKVFTTDPFVLSLIASIMPMLVITQPINALAFVADGALFGVGGFKFASASMAMAALPSLALITYGASQVDHAALVTVWLGLGLLMSVRAVTIMGAYLLKRGPFRELSLPSDGGDRGHGRRGWVLSWGNAKLKLL